MFSYQSEDPFRPGKLKTYELTVVGDYLLGKELAESKAESFDPAKEPKSAKPVDKGTRGKELLVALPDTPDDEEEKPASAAKQPASAAKKPASAVKKPATEPTNAPPAADAKQPAAPKTQPSPKRAEADSPKPGEKPGTEPEKP